MSIYSKLKASFCDYFSFEEAPYLDEALAKLGNGSFDWDQTHPWHISYLIGEEDGQRFMEIYATNRFTNDRHLKIMADGSRHYLEAAWESYGYNPEIEGDKEAKQQAFYEHNRRIYAELKKKGLF